MTSAGQLWRMAKDIRNGVPMWDAEAMVIERAAMELEQLAEQVTKTRARTTDPSTSHMAAQSVTGKTETHAEILNVLAIHVGLTDQQLADVVAKRGIVRVSPSGLRSRRAELVRLGKVRERGLVRLDSGRLSKQWGIA